MRVSRTAGWTLTGLVVALVGCGSTEGVTGSDVLDDDGKEDALDVQVFPDIWNESDHADTASDLLEPTSELPSLDIPGDMSCPADKSHLLPDIGTCVQCLNSTHCDTAQFCDQELHECLPPPCPGNGHLCDDGHCHQCCDDSHCAGGLGASKSCIDNICVYPYDWCGNNCASPYPACALVDGTWQCVQCDSDDDCPGVCVCDTEAYSCVDPVTGRLIECGGGPKCYPLPCSTVEECPPAPFGQTIDCLDEGFCHDVTGRCDGVVSCCMPGQLCVDLMMYLVGIPQPGDPPNGYCTCDTDDDCLGPDPCTDMSLLCVLPETSAQACPDGKLMEAIPQKMCVDMAALVADIQT
ncbi:MAG: hypothetical protein ISR64_01190 [Deltaproteobacteria bacterium]|nr:hypothetical protein [Deltaproteobacteria bacterium]